jgi:outer membrane receptor for ferrienterochelin and colicins
MNRLFLLLAVFSGLRAQEKTTDTLSTVSFPEIVVTATRSTLSLTDSPSPIEVLRSDNIGSGTGNSADKLLLRANGLFLQDLGGEAALKTASLRGTAPQHLLILVNGTRLTSFQNGLVDLSLLPLTDIDRVEVLRGGTSALYGADALGGVVNILTRSAGSDLHARAEANIGSFGFQRWAVEGDGRIGPLGLLAGIMQAEGRDDYPFSIPRPGASDSSMKRTNSDFRRRQAYAHGDVSLDQGSILTFMGQVARSESGVPGSVTFPSPEARQEDDNANLQLGYRTDALQGIVIEIQSMFHYGFQNYLDPNPFYPIDTYYHNSSISVNPQIRATPFEGFRTTFGGELSEARLRGGDFSGIVKRAQQALYLCGEFQWNFDRPWGDRLSVFGTARYDNFSDVDRVVTPKVGINLRLMREGDIRLRASYGKSFRAPSFNDLYFVGFNNPDLKPERSSNADIGLMAGWNFLGRHSVEVTWYSLHMNNRIIFDLNTFRPENIGRSSSTGLEAHYSGVGWDDALRLTANYTYTDARRLNRDSAGDPSYNKQLPFIPAHLFNLSLTVNVNLVSFSIYHHIGGRRFTNNDNSQSLPMYRYTNLSVSVPFAMGAMRLRLGASVDNIFDLQFSVVPGYPMPGRKLKAGIRLEV